MKLRHGIQVKLIKHRNYLVIYTDELGRAAVFDTHGPVLLNVLAPHELRELRLEDILHRRAFERP